MYFPVQIKFPDFFVTFQCYTVADSTHLTLLRQVSIYVYCVSITLFMVAYHRHEYIYPNFSRTIFKSPDFSHVFPLVATLLPVMPLTVGEQSKQSQQRLTAAAVALPQDAPEELVADVAALQWRERVTAEVMLVSSTWTAPYWCLSLRLLLLLSWCSWWPRRSFTLQWWLNTVHNIIMHTLHTHTYFYSTKKSWNKSEALASGD